MTELIDLATLATLGQHFATLEDVAELKASLMIVQNDLALIKNFLTNQYGLDFGGIQEETGDEYENVQVYKEPAPAPKRMRVNGGMQKPVAVAPVVPTQRSVNRGLPVQTRSKPPPLQRFTVISRGNLNEDPKLNRLTTYKVSGNGSTSTSASSAGAPIKREGGEETKKFSRFLSMGSVKKNNGGSGGPARPSNGVELLKRFSQNANIKVEPQPIVKTMPQLKMIAEHVEEEDNYYDGTEGYNETEEAVYNEEEEAYDDTIQMTTEEGEMKFDAPTYENYEEEGNEGYEGQEDDGMYRDNYDAEETEMITPNEIPSQKASNTTRTLANGTRIAVSMRTEQRRVSMPASVPSNSASQAQGGEDPNYLKNCKVCHEGIPAYALFNHVIDSHYNGEVPTCTICKKTFTYKQGLISHMRYHDAQKYDKACSYCGKRFIRRSDVVIHERRLHTGERPYQCPVPQCNQGFVRRYCLLTHVKTNHGEPYMSQILAQSARRKSS